MINKEEIGVFGYEIRSEKKPSSAAIIGRLNLEKAAAVESVGGDLLKEKAVECLGYAGRRKEYAMDLNEVPVGLKSVHFYSVQGKRVCLLTPMERRKRVLQTGFFKCQGHVWLSFLTFHKIMTTEYLALLGIMKIL
ncbi:hypothetical protein FXO38_32818 [Capsicum annuum]|nr:hypothetical protein FXO38_32818 [Capsicum annuum]KAF3620361.1 hypothetical protein FXO37_33303 [Capsicum annuum]